MENQVQFALEQVLTPWFHWFAAGLGLIHLAAGCEISAGEARQLIENE
jgi:hypothetical protein